MNFIQHINEIKPFDMIADIVSLELSPPKTHQIANWNNANTDLVTGLEWLMMRQSIWSFNIRLL